MRIGFIGSTFRNHSVSHLLRWVVRELKHDLFFYYLDTEIDAVTHWFGLLGPMWIADPAAPPRAICDHILSDELDILIDLDSISVGRTVAVMLHLKKRSPRPATVSYLGFDGAGLCDYLIADNYVLPPNAQEYYREKIIRLPGCYLTCGGWEIGLPEFTREQLGVPRDAFVFGAIQKPKKYSAEYLNAVGEILKRCEQAHLLVKTFTDSSKPFQQFERLAPGRVHLLPGSEDDKQARANLRLIDVVLDTFPYNGVTTTLECLWQGIPVISRYGQQWASRQGYSLLKAAGLPLFAHDWQVYIDTAEAILDPEFYHSQVAWLHSSRHISRLWDTAEYCKNFEAALNDIID